ncbi:MULTISPECIES: AEC family transporter [unclassified Brenneria]|uniref:AEC family transporter n=1 Tax=unclassified Brenneria TaxID=2634434 RepID=UPI0018F06D9F|nr:AEC family transporter [Brenneria sp. L3-3C-1]MBJ7223567.1 AEC family transporter [Brenneria sp. L3-3C-1]MEE3644809.1 AEC family transporter [Brenneria sp. L3_3C_1]
MFLIVAPIFLVILVGYGYGRLKPDSGGADKLINDYVLYVALPALLFIAVARADAGELKQWGFILSTLIGIAASYVIATVLAKSMKIGLPQSSILGMGACYGTTGYMGVPILISVYGEQAALPAALATILHNIPAIMAVIISWDVFSKHAREGRTPLLQSVGSAALTTVKNPLTISVLAGLAFVLLDIRVPVFIESFARFLGNAAGPTALFALGLGLARLNVREHLNPTVGKIVLPMIALKLFVQPAVTFAAAVYVFGMGQEQGLWLAAAIVMAAQPIGAGVYVFAKKYDYQQDVISLSIIVSLLLALVTIPLVLNLFPAP